MIDRTTVIMRSRFKSSRIRLYKRVSDCLGKIVSRRMTVAFRKRRSDSRAREKKSRRKKKRGETRGGRGLSPRVVFPTYNLTRSPLTAALLSTI